ncbi:ANTH domain-containing protein [Hygrophoropsis aurantiaca]|uniref:ANTH domain-containing protein n=1 Tax=Hygrophoropsis aurantiaca TaxID=72124 RepID=A0ACB7ZZE7_9AGAM|nr:ANTH domain-containing protein [Hygrophoropsis aurantiaca]
MSSFDKVVKLACKPKAAPPKAKYLDPIIAATWSEDGAVHDVCKALAPRLREPNAIIVFKALIVLHTMIRNGATDNVLAHLSSTEVLRLRNVSAGNWEGYNAPENLQNYAVYLDARIRAYRELKHDAIRVQAETNRDMRVNSGAFGTAADGSFTEGDQDLGYGGSSGNGTGYRASGKSSTLGNGSKGKKTTPQRSKTIMGRKLRVMTVEKGLLRETKTVQKMIDTLVECRFYLDDLEDELTITALRMLVKDLLILFQAGNEGVINVLGESHLIYVLCRLEVLNTSKLMRFFRLPIFPEHYFEMSKVDAEQALAIYRHFCKQTERVVEYLGVAKKLQNLLNVSIPNLKHAPVSLAGALQEYLNDPNFEQNRIEYRASKEAADKNGGVVKAPRPAASAGGSAPKVSASASTPASGAGKAVSNSDTAASAAPAKPDGNAAMIDFFNSIEEDQPTIFNPQTGSPTTNYFHQQQAAAAAPTGHNPFMQRQMAGAFPPQATGAFVPQPTRAFLPQSTGFPVQAQPTGFPGLQQPFQNPNANGQTNGFGLQPQPHNQSQPIHRPFSAFVQPQATGFQGSQPPLPQQPTGFLQPQATGANPFRQSVFLPQSTGMPQFNMGANAFAPQQPQQGSSSPFSAFNSSQQQPQQSQSSSFPQGQSQGQTQPQRRASMDLPARPASTPLTALGSSSGSASGSASGSGSGPSPPMAQPVKTHQTGSRNPFGVPITPTPPVPKPPTLMELAMGFGGAGQFGGQNESGLQPQQTGAFGAFGNQSSSAFTGQGSSTLGNGDSSISSVASSFAFNKKPEGKLGLYHQSTPSGSTTTDSTSDSIFSSFSPLTSQPTGATVTSSAPSISVSSPGAGSAPLKPQTTGFGGMKAFKPTSSFGASLLESLPPIPQSGPTTPDVTGMGALNSQATGAPPSSFSRFGGGVGANGGTTVGVGLRPQMTGTMGGANPFRASMFAASGTGNGTGGAVGAGANGSAFPPLPSSTSTPQFGGAAAFGGTFSGSAFGGSGGANGIGAFPSSFNPGNGSVQDPWKQQDGSASLI